MCVWCVCISAHVYIKMNKINVLYFKYLSEHLQFLNSNSHICLQFKHDPKSFYSSHILLKHRNLSFILLIKCTYFFPISIIIDISQFIKSCSCKSVITYIISNTISFPILLLNICIKVPRVGDLRKQDNGSGLITLCYISFFVSPNLRIVNTQQRMNERLNEQVNSAKQKNKMKSSKFGKISYSSSNHPN